MPKQAGEDMNVLYENGSVGEIMLDIKHENDESLARLCEKELICSFLSVSPKPRHIKGELFKYIGSYLLYLPAFYVPKTSGKTKFYLLKSIALNENSLVEGSQYHFSESGKLQKPVKEVYETVYLEGIFGFKVIDEECRLFKKGYIRVISCADEAKYRISLDKNTNKITILPQLPSRYLLDKYFDSIKQIRTMIRPKGITVEVPFSATVRKEI